MDDLIFFENAGSLYNWLDKNHLIKKVLWVCYYKKHTKIPSITWDESVQEALCYGWIDGLRKSINTKSYRIRFTPRKKDSIWSKKNIDTVGNLIKEKRMKPPGLKVFHLRKEHKSGIYSYEQPEMELSERFIKILKKDKVAWKYFSKLVPSTKKPTIRWVMSAKKQETKERRIAILLESCRAEELVPSLRWTKKKL